MSADRTDVVVVGDGPMGASAAKHLGASGLAVTLVGPLSGRPADHRVFSSHDDRSRITRVLDPDPFWARVAAASIARYRGIEQDSGVAFYTECGVLAVGPEPADGTHDLEALARSAEAHGHAVERYDARSLADRFPFLVAGDGVGGVHQRRAAGWIDPRAFVDAQRRRARHHGVELVRDVAEAVRPAADGVEVRTREGARLHARRALVAAGAYTDLGGLLPARLGIRPRAATVVHARLDETDARRLEGMPALIRKARDPSSHCYVLPPVRAPDGARYLKIGGQPGDALADEAALRRWFAGAGDPQTAARLRGLLAALLPDVRPLAFRPQPCVVALTDSGRPVIAMLDGGPVGVLAGGNGYAAKSGDELGRLGAALLTEHAAGTSGP